MARVAKEGTETMGQIIDEVVDEMIKTIYPITENMSEKNKSGVIMAHHAIHFFARTLKDTFTSRDMEGIRVAEIKVL